MSPLRRWLTYWLPPLAYMAAIFCVSHRPTVWQPLTFSYGDKVAHALAYALLGVLLRRAWQRAGTARSQERAGTYALLVGALYGLSDEVHQRFVPGRCFDWTDWMADVLGITLAMLACSQPRKSARMAEGDGGMTPRKNRRPPGPTCVCALLGAFLAGTACNCAAEEPPPEAESPPAAETPAEETPPQPTSPPQKGPFTGLIIDACALPLQRVMAPRIFGPAEVRLFPPQDFQMTVEELNERGAAGFAQNLTEAKKLVERIGTNPLYLIAWKADPEDPAGGTMIVTEKDAQRIQAADAETHFLAQGRVVILIGLKVLEVHPPPDATNVPVDTEITLRLSKHLLDSRLQPSWLTVQAADGTKVGGQLRYHRNAYTLQFKPAQPLAPGTRYTVTLSKDVQAQNRCVLGEDFTWSFTTLQPPEETEGEKEEGKEGIEEESRPEENEEKETH